MNLVQETLERIGKHKGVLGCIIAGNDASVHKTTLEEHLTQEYTSMIPSLTALARNMVRELDPQVCTFLGENQVNDLEFLRVRSAKHEIMVAPKGDYVLIVIQDANLAV